MQLSAFEPFVSLYVALAALWVALAWLSFRAKRRVRREGVWLSEPGCIGNSYELLRRIGTGSTSNRDQQSRWRDVPVSREGIGATLMAFLAVALVGWGW
jgi:hypothetical protein